MKDYSQQITTILVSYLKRDDTSSSDTNRIPGVSGISTATKAINTLINNEVYALELQIVDLTEQLSETDSLLIEAKKAMAPRTRSRLRVSRLSRTVK